MQNERDLKEYLRNCRPHSRRSWDRKKRGRFHAPIIDVVPQERALDKVKRSKFFIPLCVLFTFLSASMLLGCAVDTVTSGTYYFQSFANGLAATAFTASGCLLS